MACCFPGSETCKVLPIEECSGTWRTALALPSFEKPAPSRKTLSTASLVPPRPKPRAPLPPWDKLSRTFCSTQRLVSLAEAVAEEDSLARSFAATHSPMTRILRRSPSPVDDFEWFSLLLLTPQAASHSRRAPSFSHGMPSFSKTDLILATTFSNGGFRM